MLKQRIVTAAVLLTAIVWALFFAAPWVWGVLSLVLFAAAGWEWGALLGRAGPVGGDGGAGEGADASAGSRAAIGVTAAVTVAGLAWLAWRGGFELGAGTDGTGPWLAALLVVDLLLWLGLALPAVLAAKPRGDHPAFATVAIFCLWVAVLELRLIHPVLVLSAMAIVWFADVGAYFVGRAVGRRKLAVRVSPNKSWEGAWGGLATVLVIAALAWWAWPDAPVLSNLLASRAGLSLAALALTAIVALSIVGDLYESLLKRANGVKDSGRLLPGHGGVLDRIDALVPTMPACLLLWQALAR
ncbi:MAG: phosphatidate cytidylyltransferase [Burkholderiaceae bacterium]|nr:phosphatidate cytidylyltransferase [Burkholderiaceae bacterium]